MVYSGVYKQREGSQWQHSQTTKRCINVKWCMAWHVNVTIHHGIVMKKREHLGKCKFINLAYVNVMCL